ncbi:hypothetical protein J6590_034447 [Homalodisca vitripennis]|nr:hypothetical protein J6590_034447 [Homalodisca vitripennis]
MEVAVIATPLRHCGRTTKLGHRDTHWESDNGTVLNPFGHHPLHPPPIPLAASSVTCVPGGCYRTPHRRRHDTAVVWPTAGLAEWASE